MPLQVPGQTAFACTVKQDSNIIKKKVGDENMILKRKEIVAASLVVLIGMAGYLNWSYQDTIQVTDNESYVQTGKTHGQAEMVLANNEVTVETEEDKPNEEKAEEEKKTEKKKEKKEKTDEKSQQTASVKDGAYFDDAKMNRQTARAAAMESLKATAADEAMDEATRTLAGEKLVACADNIETESRIENVAASKGFKDICAYVNEDSATITVKSNGLNDDDVLKLKDIVISSADISADNIKIIEVK